MHLLKKIGYGIALNVVALYVVIDLLDKVTYTGGWPFFLVTGTLIGTLNAFLKPLLKFVSLPLVFMSGGLFLIVINAGILWMTDQLLEIFDFTGIDLIIEGPVTFVIAAVLFGLTNWFTHWLLKRVT